MTEALATPLASSFGKYRVIAELGSGGMATVYLAVMRGKRDVHKLVVLKVPRSTILQDPELLAMFVDEARLAARLSHQNLVQTYEIIEEEGRDIIVMEYLDGKTLGQVLTRARQLQKPLPLGMQLQVVMEALSGLHYAHELKNFDGHPLGVVHRDISPPNIFLTFEGQVKVLDFGVAKAAISTHETQLGTYKGKLRYMPAEQFKGGNVDRRADIFAVGAILWDVATGKPLWGGLPDHEVISRVLGRQVPAPRSVSPNVPPKLDAIIQRALAFRPEDRYATALELRADLEVFVRSLPEQYSIRDLGHLVTSMFAESAAKRRAAIEQQVANAIGEADDPKSGAAPIGSSGAVAPSSSSSSVRSVDRAAESALPVLGPDLQRALAEARASIDAASTGTNPEGTSPTGRRTSPTGKGSSPTGRRTSPTGKGSASSGRRTLPSGRASSDSSPSGVPTGDDGLSPSGVGSASGTSPSTAGGVGTVSAAPARGKAIVALVIVAALGIGGAIYASQKSGPAPSQPAANTATATPPAPGAQMAVLRVTVDPPAARIFLDNIPVASNPLAIPTDGSRHTLRAEAPGYTTKSIEVVFDGGKELVIALDRSAGAQVLVPPSKP